MITILRMKVTIFLLVDDTAIRFIPLYRDIICITIDDCCQLHASLIKNDTNRPIGKSKASRR